MRAAVFQVAATVLALANLYAIALTVQQGGGWWVLLPIGTLIMVLLTIAGSVERHGLLGGRR